MLDETGQLAWARDLQAFSASASSSGSSSTAAAAAAAHAAGPCPTPPGPALDLSVSLLATSLRYEPRDASKAAAVLAAASITWQAQHGQQHSSLEARRLALHVAAPAAGTARPSMGQQSVFAASADVAGFHQVAAEAGISVQLPAAALVPVAGQAAAPPQPLPQPLPLPQPAMQEVVVRNRGLSITLSRQTLLLLHRLSRQLPNRSSSSNARRPGPGTSAAAAGAGDSGAGHVSGSLSPDHLASSAISTVSGSSSASSCRGQEAAPALAAAAAPPPAAAAAAAVNVMQGVVQSAYASPRRAVEHALEASVFLDGE